MTAKDFLALLGSMVAHRLPGNAAHLQRLAPVIAERVPSRWFGTELAERAAPHLLDRMKPDELVAVLRREGEFVKPTRTAATAGPRSARPETPEEREAREEAEDRAWWENRLEGFASIANPTTRWRQVVGFASVVNRPGAHPRPYLVGRIREILDEAEQEGADTDRSRVPALPERRPALGMPHPYQRSRIEAVPPPSRQPALARAVSPAQARRIAEDREDHRLRLLAEGGDEMAAYRLAFRQEQRVQAPGHQGESLGGAFAPDSLGAAPEMAR